MKIHSTPTLNIDEKQAIFNLWNNEYPSQLKYANMEGLEQYLQKLNKPAHYFALDDSAKIVGWAFVFEREQETWFAIIVESHLHKKGIGKALLNKLKASHGNLNGWVIDHNSYIKENGEP